MSDRGPSRLLLQARAPPGAREPKETDHDDQTAGVTDDWDDNQILLFEEFCTFIRTPQSTVREWRRLNRGPRWWRFNGNGRLYTTVAELRHFLKGGE